MVHSIVSFMQMPLLLVSLFPASITLVQDATQKSAFYEVQMTKEEVYSYTNLKFKGDYTTFESPAGSIVLGKTELGVTVVIVLGGGSMAIEAPDAVQEKFKTVFGGYPLHIRFKTLYMRISPKEYAETFGKQSLTKTNDEAALAKAKELFDLKFLASYHAGSRAILPDYRTRVFEFDTDEFGQISNEEGYWIKLRRLSPYGSVYPANFVNPKQRYTAALLPFPGGWTTGRRQSRTTSIALDGTEIR
jgi:hypothetical protein